MKKGKGLSLNVVIFAAIVLLILVILVLLVLRGVGIDNRMNGTNYSDEQLEIVPIERVFQEEALETRLRKEYQPDRSTYGFGYIVLDKDGDGEREKVRFRIADVAKNICNGTIPDDFWRYKYETMTGQITMSRFKEMGECIYNQPEWIRDNFEDRFIDSKYRNPDLTHWTPEGYGTYPHQMEFQRRPGDTFSIYTFFHTSYGVERYQGVRLAPAFPKEGLSNEGTIVSVNPSLSKQYVDVEITPGEVITSPTYALFEMGWIKKIHLNVTVANNTPKGYYAVGYDVAQPSIVQDAKWRREYGVDYQPLGNIRVERNQFVALVKVV